MSDRLLSARLLREMKTTVGNPENPDSRYGLGIERVQDRCGVNWGHTGAIFGYQAAAFWNERTRRTVVTASTMWPIPPAAHAPLGRATDHALCATPWAGPPTDPRRETHQR